MARTFLILGLLLAAGLVAWQLVGDEAPRAVREAERPRSTDEPRAAPDAPVPPAEKTAELRGLVKGDDALPLAGVEVVVARGGDEPPLRRKTGEDGRFRLDVPAGPWTFLRLAHPDYLPFESGAKTDFDNEFTLERGARFTVLVLGPDGKPVADAKVSASYVDDNTYGNIYFGTIERSLGDGVTGADGRLLLGAVPATPFELRVSHPSFATFREEVELRELRAVEHVVRLHEGGAIEGTVFDPAGEPVAGATVEAGDRSGKSDASGNYRLERVQVGFVTVLAGKPEYGPSFFGERIGWDDPVPVEVRLGETTAPIDVHLGKPTFVTGRVTDGKGTAIADAYLSVSVWGGHATDREYRTGADGRFRAGPFSVFRRAMVHVYARAEGYQYRNSGGRPVEAGQSIDIGTLELARGAVVRGRCVDAEGAPVAGASVNVDPGSTATQSDGDGRFELTNVPPGKVTLLARGGERISRRVPVEVAGQAVVEGVVLEMGAPKSITGRVTTGDGDPRPNIILLAREMALPEEVRRFRAHSATTGDDGSYEFGGLAPGTYEVSLLGYGRNVFWASPLGEVRHVEAGSDEVDFTFPFTGGIVTAKVVSARTGRPLDEYRYSTIRFRGFLPDVADSGRRRDPDGRFRFEFAHEGRWAVEFGAKGHASFRTPAIRLKKGQEHDFGTIRLGEGGVIEGRVVDAQGRPVPFTRINILSPKFETNDEEPFTGLDGAFRVRGVAPGMYIVFAVSPRHPIGMVKNVLVGEGKTARVEVKFARSAPLEVIVQGADGQPLIGAELWWTFPEIAPLTSKMVREAIPPGYGDHESDEDGRILQHGLPAGPVTLIVEAEGFTPVTKQLRLTAGEATRIEIRMTPKK